MIPHGPALHFLACMVVSHTQSFVIHAGIDGRNSTWCLQGPPIPLPTLAWVFLPQGKIWWWSVLSCPPAAFSSSAGSVLTLWLRAGWEGGQDSCPVVRGELAGGCLWPSSSDVAAVALCPNQLGRRDLSQSWCSWSMTQIGGYLFQ